MMKGGGKGLHHTFSHTIDALSPIQWIGLKAVTVWGFAVSIQTGIVHSVTDP